jgi:hypothetical protein
MGEEEEKEDRLSNALFITNDHKFVSRQKGYLTLTRLKKIVGPDDTDYDMTHLAEEIAELFLRCALFGSKDESALVDKLLSETDNVKFEVTTRLGNDLVKNNTSYFKSFFSSIPDIEEKDVFCKFMWEGEQLRSFEWHQDPSTYLACRKLSYTINWIKGRSTSPSLPIACLVPYSQSLRLLLLRGYEQSVIGDKTLLRDQSKQLLEYLYFIDADPLLIDYFSANSPIFENLPKEKGHITYATALPDGSATDGILQPEFVTGYALNHYRIYDNDNTNKQQILIHPDELEPNVIILARNCNITALSQLISKVYHRALLFQPVNCVVYMKSSYTKNHYEKYLRSHFSAIGMLLFQMLFSRDINEEKREYINAFFTPALIKECMPMESQMGSKTVADFILCFWADVIHTSAHIKALLTKLEDESRGKRLNSVLLDGDTIKISGELAREFDLNALMHSERWTQFYNAMQ